MRTCELGTITLFIRCFKLYMVTDGNVLTWGITTWRQREMFEFYDNYRIVMSDVEHTY